MIDMNAASIDSLLDSTLDDLADLPEFKIFPAGAYNGSIELTVKKMGDTMGVELKFTNQEVMELSDPTTAEADIPAAGATTSVGFLLNNEFGQGALKKVLESLKEGLQLPPGLTNRQTMEASKGTVCLVVFTTRADKNDASKVYQGLKKLMVV